MVERTPEQLSKDIEDEIKALNLVKSVVQDPVYQRAIEFVIQTLGWVLDADSKDFPSKNIAEQFAEERASGDGYKFDAQKPEKEKTLPPAGAAVSASPVTFVMEIDGDRFVVPPFPWRELDENNDLLHEYLKEFVENLKTYVGNVFGQVNVSRE